MSTYVGHEQKGGLTSYFPALNNQGHVQIIEFPGNNAPYTLIFFGPSLTGSDASTVPATLCFSDLGKARHHAMRV